MKSERLLCVGVSHKTAPIALREQLSQWPLGDLRTNDIEELVILSTCNRLEIYGYLTEHEDGWAHVDPRQPLIDLIAAVQELAPPQFVEHLYDFQGDAAVLHLCRVAAGLESLVMGEGQILGQVRTALQRAHGNQTVGPVLSLLFRTAIDAGKRARTETQISTNAVSVSSAAVALAEQVVDDLRQEPIAVIGLGEIGQLALKGLVARRATQFTLVNRTFQKAEWLATHTHNQHHVHSQVARMEDLPHVLTQANIVFTATSATEPLLTVELMQMVMRERNNRPLILIDLAVPRNIAAAVAVVPGIQLYDVDDLRAAVDNALDARRAEVPQVEAIIDELLVEWHRQCKELRLRPVVVGLRQQAEQTRRRVVERTLRYLEREQGTVDAAVAAQLQYLSQALVNQLLHEPTVRLKAHAAQPDGAAYAALVCDLFDLNVPIPATETDVDETDTEAEQYPLMWVYEEDDAATLPATPACHCATKGTDHAMFPTLHYELVDQS
ncbi:MAG: glutamyl-tRNA reductase [Caldilineaceae bacterium]|nr:glutamyl-tRNA reductase [Caldilineaceae bacterium]